MIIQMDQCEKFVNNWKFSQCSIINKKISIMQGILGYKYLKCDIMVLKITSVLLM